MTRDEVIKLAREAGFVRTKMHGALERFAELVSAAKNEDCAKLCDEREVIERQKAKQYREMRDIAGAQDYERNADQAMLMAQDIRARGAK